ncbi:hypothetical protein [Streptomyces axinellae]|uniref:Uncharacterized protein n=1 Tax=Streptomyces axinellae TaxID=552788 RepID=A0ABN3QCX3_9ACTN
MPNEYSDEEYAATLDLWNPVDLPHQPDMQWEIDGRLADLLPFGAEPTAALQQHDLPPEQRPDDWRTVPQTRKKTTWRDEDYAAALNAREEGNLPGSTEKQEVMIGDQRLVVPIGQFLHNLRNKGRKKALGDVLKNALSKHDLSPLEGDGWWKLPQVPKRTRWRDEDYAAALNAWEKENLPGSKETQEVMIGSRLEKVPIGQFLHTLRNEGRVNPLREVLTQALTDHGLPPGQILGGRWTIPQVPQKTMWRDEDYAAALNAWEKENLPGPTEKQKVMIGGRPQNVPIGQCLHNLRTRGRKKALEDVLTNALSKHDQWPREVDGRWKLPQVPQKTMWRDEDYAAALNAWEKENLPGPTEKQKVMIDGRPQNVPIGKCLHNLRNNGRKRALEEVLTNALKQHDLSPTLQEGTWKIVTTAQAESAGRSANEQAPSQSFTAPVAPPAWNASAARGTTTLSGDYPDRSAHLVNPVPAWANLPDGHRHWPAAPTRTTEPTPHQPPNSPRKRKRT